MTEREATYWMIVAALLAAVVLYLVGASLPADAGTYWRHTQIRYQGLEPGDWTDREVRLSIVAAVDRWPVPGGAAKAISVAQCESHLNERASNDGDYLGVYQQAARYWPGRQDNFDSASWSLHESAFNARANVIVSIRQAHAGGWGPWEMGSCA